MMDIVERLRTVKLLSQRNQYALQEEAAAEITRLRADRDGIARQCAGMAGDIAEDAWQHTGENFACQSGRNHGARDCQRAILALIERDHLNPPHNNPA